MFAAILLAGCGRLGFDAGAPVDAPIEGSVAIVRQQGGWGPIDLTAEGRLDWMHLGLGGVNAVNRKASLGQLLGNVTQVGGGTLVFTDKQDPQLDTSWSDGSPVTSAGPVTTTFMIDTANLSGDGFAFRAAATTTPRTLRVYAGVWCARIRLAAKLVDESAPGQVDTTWDFPFSSYELGQYSVSYQAASDTTLELTLTIDLNHCVTGDVGEVWLSALTLAAG